MENMFKTQFQLYRHFRVPTVEECEKLLGKAERGLIDEIQSYIINNKAVIIFWKDGKKTVATVDERDTFDKELGFAISVFKYANINSKASYKRMLECIKEGTFITSKQIGEKKVTEEKSYLKMFMEDYFNNVTFKDMEKSRKFLKSLKATGKREKYNG